MSPNMPSITYCVALYPSPSLYVCQPGIPSRPLPLLSCHASSASPIADLAYTLLSHYFTATQGLDPSAAQARAVSHRTSLSRLLSARLARTATDIRLTIADIDRQLLHVASRTQTV